MGVQKKAEYKVHNGTDFDTINFKTILEQVKFTDGTSLKDFFDNGGTIGGSIKTNRIERIIPSNAIDHGYGFGIGIKSANGLDKLELIVGNNANKKGVYPVQRMYLGTPEFAFSEIWAGDYNRGIDGYTQLPNGLYLQWGSIWTSGITTGSSVSGSITLPIRFPNKGLALVVSAELARDPYGANLYSAKFYPAGCYFTSPGTFDYKVQGIDYISGGAVCNYIAIGY